TVGMGRISRQGARPPSTGAAPSEIMSMSQRTNRVRCPRFPRFDNQARLRCEYLEERAVLAIVGPMPVDNGQLFAIDPSQYQASDILVCFRTDVPASALVGRQFAAGTEIGGGFALTPGLHQISLGPGISVSDALAAYRASPLVMYAQPDYSVHLNLLPNDPQF